MSTNLFNPADKRSYPARWPMFRGKQLFKVIDERSEEGTEELLSVSHITGITPRSQKNVTMFKSESLIGYKLCQIGDIAANTMWTWQGAIGVSKYLGVVSPAYNVYRQNGDIYNPRFLDILLRERTLVDVYHSLSTGVRASRLRLYPDAFLTIPFPVPPRTEQDQIVRFVDWKVSGINRLIASKRKQLGLVEEIVRKQFQNVSDHASQRSRLKYFVSISNDFITIDNSQYYMKTGMYNRGRGIFRREPILGEDMGDSSFQRIHAGCVMISGQFAWEAATYITTKEDEVGVASHRYYLLAPNKELPSEYIWCFLMSDYGQMQMKLCSHGAAGRNRPLNIKELLNVYIPVVSKCKELEMLVKNVRHLMALRSNLMEQEKVLAELRSRLLTDIISGKIDVREVDIPDYESVENEYYIIDETDDEEDIEEEEN